MFLSKPTKNKPITKTIRPTWVKCFTWRQNVDSLYESPHKSFGSQPKSLTFTSNNPFNTLNTVILIATFNWLVQFLLLSSHWHAGYVFYHY